MRYSPLPNLWTVTNEASDLYSTTPNNHPVGELEQLNVQVLENEVGKSHSLCRAKVRWYRSSVSCGGVAPERPPGWDWTDSQKEVTPWITYGT